MNLRKTYDNPIYGKKRTASSFEESRDAILSARPDAHLEGSAGFAWSFLSKDNRFVIGVSWYSPRSGKYYYRYLEEGGIEW